MPRISPASIAATILTAPGWALLGLTVRDQRLRERAADVLAAKIAAELNDEPAADHRQIALPL